MRRRFANRALPMLAAALALAAPPIRAGAAGDAPAAAVADSSPRFGTLVALVSAAPLVLTVEVRKAIALDPARARDVGAGMMRAYVVARPLAALKGALPAAPLLSFLVDVPQGVKGRLPPLAKQHLLLFARPVAGNPAMLQLVAPTAGLETAAPLEQRVGAVLAALAADDAPPRVTGVSEAIYVPGTLSGEGQAQFFLVTASHGPAAITVTHRPGQPAGWSVSFSEVVDASGRPPAPDTLATYRLACGLPRQLPAGVNVSGTAEDRAQAAADYAQVLADLGPCPSVPGL
ncbi:MAG: hypothetical protein KGK11_05385 [Sphingomonadales bacterium]|nr:hypothetical protein [Sphingomonadales bacterium]